MGRVSFDLTVNVIDFLFNMYRFFFFIYYATVIVITILVCAYTLKIEIVFLDKLKKITICQLFCNV